MAEKQLIVAVEGTAAVGPYWKTIISDYLDKILRSFCGNDSVGQKPPAESLRFGLVVFYTHDSNSACLVQRSGWTHDIDIFFQWLSSLSFRVGAFSDAAIAEGLSEVLMMLMANQAQQNVEGQRHCILIAASNPYPLPTPVYRPRPLKMEQTAQTHNLLSDAETIAKYFGLCSVSLSIICPKQLPKLKAIFNAGKCNPRTDPPFDSAKNPSFLVLISENLMEGLPVKVDTNSAQPVSTPIPPANDGNIQPVTVKVEPPTVTPGMQQPGVGDNTVANMSLFQQYSVTLQSALSEYVKFWEGNIFGQRLGQPVLLTRLEGYRSASASESLAANWPEKFQIVRLISQNHMSINVQ